MGIRRGQQGAPVHSGQEPLPLQGPPCRDKGGGRLCHQQPEPFPPGSRPFARLAAATSPERLTLAWLQGLIRTTQRLPRWVLGPLQAGQHGGKEGETALVASLQKTLQGTREKRNGVSPSARNWGGGRPLHQHHKPSGKEDLRRVPASKGAVHSGEAKFYGQSTLPSF